ncbi:MAG: class I SAM-dependent methyltransferase [Hyphomicrobiales bacterium]|nr:class I SAM-dependent methyltransferase [Hyphomicrobiales bacterium]
MLARPFYDQKAEAGKSMHPDVLDLRDFYRTPLGLMARRIIAHRVRARWRDGRGLDFAGVGYATPFMRPFLGEASRIIALMPKAQGAIAWPTGRCATALVDETHLPFADMTFDRIVMAHCLEHSEATGPLLREMWRVLRPEGRLLIVAPNRRGLWARAESTPFGHGRPFSPGQIEALLTSSLFAVECVTPALFAPPWPWRTVLHGAVAWERAGARLWPIFAGVLIVDAVKQVYARLPDVKGRRARVRQAVGAPIRNG